MPEWHLVDHDPARGVRKYVAADVHEDDAVLVKTAFDPTVTQAIVEANKYEQNEATGPMGDGLQKVASIPIAVQFDWWHRYRVNSWSPNEDDQKMIRKLLNSNEWRYLKCRDIII